MTTTPNPFTDPNPFADQSTREDLGPIEPRCILDSLDDSGTRDIEPANFIFDIETAPRPWEEIEPFLEPFAAQEFDPSTVKCGDIDRLKRPDAEKSQMRQEKIAKAKAAFEETIQTEEQWRESILSKATLDPLWGEICAIGYGWRRDKDGCEIIALTGQGREGHSEARMIHDFWCHFLWTRHNQGKLGGHGITSFDVPWLINRARFHRIAIPRGVLVQNRYLDKLFVDTMQLWGCGVYGARFVSADDLAIFLGVRRKVQHTVEGATYWKFHRSKKAKERKLAAEYLAGDIACELDIADAMSAWES